ncbi:hypothetical protein GJAV_G00129020 [Gymnothorax javanicus]|nr:hypothetical protein GJAV_G00129020 [Gymnothorax javanicus]
MKCNLSRKVKRECSSCWNTRLRAIVGLLPIDVPANGRVLTKRETLVHILQYLEFLQSYIQSIYWKLPPPCLPWIQEEETGGDLSFGDSGSPDSGYWDLRVSDISPESGTQDSHPRSSWTLFLRDQLIDSPFAMGSPSRCLQSRPLPLQAAYETDVGLNLSPSLLTAPSHGLAHLLPQGQELPALFEDI